MECRNCEIYEELIQEIFKIVREGSTKIKYQLLDVYRGEDQHVELIIWVIASIWILRL